MTKLEAFLNVYHERSATGVNLSDGALDIQSQLKDNEEAQKIVESLVRTSVLMTILAPPEVGLAAMLFIALDLGMRMQKAIDECAKLEELKYSNES